MPAAFGGQAAPAVAAAVGLVCGLAVADQDDPRPIGSVAIQVITLGMFRQKSRPSGEWTVLRRVLCSGYRESVSTWRQGRSDGAISSHCAACCERVLRVGGRQPPDSRGFAIKGRAADYSDQRATPRCGSGDEHGWTRDRPAPGPVSRSPQRVTWSERTSDSNLSCGTAAPTAQPHPLEAEGGPPNERRRRSHAWR